jgi:hypothetical protein
MTNGRGSWVPSLVVALGLLLGLGWIASAMKDIRGPRRAVTVKGFAQKRITSDYAIWTANVVVRSATMEDAYQRIERDVAKVRAYLAKEGVAEGDISVNAVSIHARYKQTMTGMATNEIELFELNQNVSVRSADVALVEKAAKGVTFLIKDGVQLQSWDPAFHYTKLDDLKIEMLGGAAADAKQRAQEIASKSGAKIGALASASQGVFQITPVYSSEISGEGWLDTSSIEKTIRAVVTVSYEIR